MGRALDLVIANINSADKARAYYILWSILQNNPPADADILSYENSTAHWFHRIRRGTNGWGAIETRSPWDSRDLMPIGGDGIQDGFELVNHLHIQDEP